MIMEVISVTVDTPIIELASRDGYVDVVKALLDAGVTLNVGIYCHWVGWSIHPVGGGLESNIIYQNLYIICVEPIEDH